MKRKIKKVILIASTKNAATADIVGEIENYLFGKGIETVFFGFNGNKNLPDLTGVDAAFSLGGDGTVLFSSRFLAPHGIPILPVNMGDFGFITEVTAEEWKSAFDKYESGYLGIKKHLMLSVSVVRNGKKIEEFTGLNDAVVCAAGISKIVRLFLSLTDTDIGEYRADGVIVSSPTGSTAYSAAAGGPILDPEMAALIINPICPFTLSNRPLVVKESELVRIKIMEKQRTEVILTIDGQNAVTLFPDDIVEIKQSSRKALIIKSDKRNFYEVLRTKLNWSGGPYA